MKLQKLKILSQSQISNDSYILKTPRTGDFKAGQSVAVSINDKLPPRLYSICSGVNEAFFEILYKVVPEGQLTPHLSRLKEGDTILMSHPMGSFIHGDEPGFWIASGTGIAPFISMLKSGIVAPQKLLHGVRQQADRYFMNELRDKLNDVYSACVTVNPSEQDFKGRVTDWLREETALPMNIKYYLCGSPEMVVDVRDLLIERGISFKQITSEIYF